MECYAPTVDASRCYPDLIGEVRVRTFLPQLPRWFPYREAIQMAAASLLMPLYAWRLRGVDAIVACNQPSAWIAWWAARLIDVPYVVYLNQPNRLVYPRSIDRETGWVANADYRLLAAIVMRATKFVAWADRRSVQEADQLLVNGDYIGDIIRGIYKRDAVDCPAGCHVAASGFPLPRDARFAGGLTINGYPIRRPYVLLTNRHYPQKRFDLAIRAMQEVRKVHPKVQLVVPGPATSHTATLQALTTELKLNDGVVFLGAITEEELNRLYEGAAVYVYPAPEEDFGMGVIESMAKGRPRSRLEPGGADGDGWVEAQATSRSRLTFPTMRQAFRNCSTIRLATRQWVSAPSNGRGGSTGRDTSIRWRKQSWRSRNPTSKSRRKQPQHEAAAEGLGRRRGSSGGGGT